MWYALVGLIVQNLYAGVPTPNEVKVDETIIVEARRNMVVYVDEPTIMNSSEKISSEFNTDSIIGYVNSHARLGKVKNSRGTYEPVTMHTDRVEVYNIDTIEYAYSDCNYKRDPMTCSIQNDHYLVKTNISINDQEIIVRMTLFDSNALIVNSSSYSSREIVKWIKQQEETTAVVTNPRGSQTVSGGNNCSGNSCSAISRTQQLSSTTTTTSKPKEELPLRFSIPPKLLDKNLHQASIGLFAGVKLD